MQGIPFLHLKKELLVARNLRLALKHNGLVPLCSRPVYFPRIIIKLCQRQVCVSVKGDINLFSVKGVCIKFLLPWKFKVFET